MNNSEVLDKVIWHKEIEEFTEGGTEEADFYIGFDDLKISELKDINEFLREIVRECMPEALLAIQRTFDYGIASKRWVEIHPQIVMGYYREAIELLIDVAYNNTEGNSTTYVKRVGKIFFEREHQCYTHFTPAEYYFSEYGNELYMNSISDKEWDKLAKLISKQFIYKIVEKLGKDRER